MENGADFNIALENFDILFRSPGWPILCPGIQSAIKKRRQTIQSDEFFL